MTDTVAKRGASPGSFIAGLVVGIALTALAVVFSMPRMMLEVEQSSTGFEETVAAIQDAAQKAEWSVPKVYDIQKSLNDAGYTDTPRMKIISLCKPEFAYNILKEDGLRKVTAMMPCRIGIYEGSGGKVYISHLNLGLMSKMFGGTIEKVMGKAGTETKEIIQAAIE